MNTTNAPQSVRERVLVVGRSPTVLDATVSALRADGFDAAATNQFDHVLDAYDISDIDIVVFGGMIPEDTRNRLKSEIRDMDPRVALVQGLAGIGGLLAAQVRAAVSGVDNCNAVFVDAATRTITVKLEHSSAVVVEAWWHTSFAPPEPASASMELFRGRLEPGTHRVAIPNDVPSEASFAAVRLDDTAVALIVGHMPDQVKKLVPTSVTDQRLPAVRSVETRFGDD